MSKELQNSLPGIGKEPTFTPGKKPIEDPGVGKFRRSGHLSDQMLTYPKKRQLSIWDSLQPQTQNRIRAGNDVEVKSIVEGIDLSPAEQKVIDSLSKMLHHRSQNINPKDPTYYTGNATAEVVSYPTIDSPSERRRAPKLTFSLYELTKEYKGGETISGKDVENVKNVLFALDSRRYLIKYIETEHKKGGGRIEREIETYSSLLQIVELRETEYSKEDIGLSRKEETVIALNPIFRNQINSKYLLLPNDINKRTIEAYGSHNVSGITLRLRDYLIREHSNKRYSPEIGLKKLYWTVSPKWMDQSRKKKVREYTEKALQVCKDIGLLKSYEIKSSKSGGRKIVFTLNKDWR